jgi:hypothetical protein
MQGANGLSGWFFTFKDNLLQKFGRGGSGLFSPAQSSSGGDSVQANILGHELRNPLNGILGMTQLLQQTQLSREQRQWLRAVYDSGIQMRRLIDELGDLRSGPDPESGVLDGVDLLEQLIVAHTPAARDKGIDLLLIVDQKLPRNWYADSGGLRQIVDNLLGNAIKFTDTGHVLLEACGSGGGMNGREGLELLVRDTGIGISTDSRHRIFAAYHREHEALAQKHEGKGLGLHICRRIVTKMNGSISCASRPGSGSCFSVRLPGIVCTKNEACFQSGLLNSLQVVVCTREPIASSVKRILSRLGVEFMACDVEATRCLGKRTGILVTDTDSLTHLGPSTLQAAGGAVVLAPSSSRFAVAQTPGWTLLHPPFLECTLGPALMEIALAARMSGR